MFEGAAQLTRVALNNLRNMPGATKQAIRKGRGRSSRRGKTAGRGHKGFGQHHGTVALGFEGGQTPFQRRQPKRGFHNPHSIVYEPLNLAKLQQFVLEGKIDVQKPIDMKVLRDSGVVGKIEHGVKLLATGAKDFTIPVHIEVSKASQTAISAVEAAGGSVTCAYYNKLGLRALLKPHKFETLPRRARPPTKLRPYYADAASRGYMAGHDSHDDAVAARFANISLQSDATPATPTA